MTLTETSSTNVEFFLRPKCLGRSSRRKNVACAALNLACMAVWIIGTIVGSMNAWGFAVGTWFWYWQVRDIKRRAGQESVDIQKLDDIPHVKTPSPHGSTTDPLLSSVDSANLSVVENTEYLSRTGLDPTHPPTRMSQPKLQNVRDVGILIWDSWGSCCLTVWRCVASILDIKFWHKRSNNQQSTITAQRSAEDDPRTRPTPRVACRHYRPSPGPTTIALNLAKALLARWRNARREDTTAVDHTEGRPGARAGTYSTPIRPPRVQNFVTSNLSECTILLSRTALSTESDSLKPSLWT